MIPQDSVVTLCQRVLLSTVLRRWEGSSSSSQRSSILAVWLWPYEDKDWGSSRLYIATLYLMGWLDRCTNSFCYLSSVSLCFSRSSSAFLLQLPHLTRSLQITLFSHGYEPGGSKWMHSLGPLPSLSPQTEHALSALDELNATAFHRCRLSQWKPSAVKLRIIMWNKIGERAAWAQTFSAIGLIVQLIKSPWLPKGHPQPSKLISYHLKKQTIFLFSNIGFLSFMCHTWHIEKL